MMPAPVSAAPAFTPPGEGAVARRPSRWVLGIILLVGLTTPPSYSADIPISNAPKLVETYCYECHGDGLSRGKIALDEMLKPGGTNDYHGNWDKAWKIVRREFMPPSNAKRPTDEERKAITQWIEQ